MKNIVQFENLDWKEKLKWQEIARDLIARGYPVPTNVIYKLAELVYNKRHGKDNNSW